MNVTQLHNHDLRDGLYIDFAFTPCRAANMMRDLDFDGTISGNVYAQPLYIEGGPGGRQMVIAVTNPIMCTRWTLMTAVLSGNATSGRRGTSEIQCRNIRSLGH